MTASTPPAAATATHAVVVASDVTQRPARVLLIRKKLNQYTGSWTGEHGNVLKPRNVLTNSKGF